MVNHISKVDLIWIGEEKNERVFRIFDHNGTYIELTPARLYELIVMGWEALDRPDWSPRSTKGLGGT